MRVTTWIEWLVYVVVHIKFTIQCTITMHAVYRWQSNDFAVTSTLAPHSLVFVQRQKKLSCLTRWEWGCIVSVALFFIWHSNDFQRAPILCSHFISQPIYDKSNVNRIDGSMISYSISVSAFTWRSKRHLVNFAKFERKSFIFGYLKFYFNSYFVCVLIYLPNSTVVRIDLPFTHFMRE